MSKGSDSTAISGVPLSVDHSSASDREYNCEVKDEYDNMSTHEPRAFSHHYARSLLETCSHWHPTSTAISDEVDWAQPTQVSGFGSWIANGVKRPKRIGDCADGALLALLELSGSTLSGVNHGSSLLFDRVPYLDLKTPDQVSANQSCRLLRARDGWIALNLAREEDQECIPAWLETSASPWSEIIPERTTDDLVSRGRLLGMPITSVQQIPRSPWLKTRLFSANDPIKGRSPLVVDLSSLWAGPLCSHLLEKLFGARVIKVESLNRPDSSRDGTPRFFDLLNSGKESVVLDLPRERDKLRVLLEKADIVIEASRPRALSQMGITPSSVHYVSPSTTWISITGYGRSDEQGYWVAFGDDAAASGGLLGWINDVPYFLGDAIADPLTGLHAAVVAIQSYWQGGGRLIDIPLANVAAFCARIGDQVVLEPEPGIENPRPNNDFARPFGVDTTEVLRGFGC